MAAIHGPEIGARGAVKNLVGDTVLLADREANSVSRHIAFGSRNRAPRFILPFIFIRPDVDSVPPRSGRIVPYADPVPVPVRGGGEPFARGNKVLRRKCPLRDAKPRKTVESQNAHPVPVVDNGR